MRLKRWCTQFQGDADDADMLYCGSCWQHRPRRAQQIPIPVFAAVGAPDLPLLSPCFRRDELLSGACGCEHCMRCPRSVGVL